MTTNPLRTALLAALAAVAFAATGCSRNDDASPGHASGEHESSSSAGLPEGRVAIGEQLAKKKGEATGQSCIDCHGAEGNAPIDATYPKLGGQYDDYIAHALQNYRGGERVHALMTPQAAKLSDQDISDLAAYFGSRPSHLRDLAGQ